MAKIWIFLLVQFFYLLSKINGYYHESITQCIYSKEDFSDMVYIDSFIFNKMEYIWFNSTVGWFEGYTEHGIYNAEVWNNDTTYIQAMRDSVDNYCKPNAEFIHSITTGRSVSPKVIVKSVKQGDGSHPALLLCSAYRFYPKYIKVTWLRDGKEIEGGVTSVEEMANGDWYYQVHSYLEYMPKSGEEISCMVEHASFNKPMIYIYKYEPPASEGSSDTSSDTSKIAVGASGLVLGIVLSAAGFIYYKKKSSGS